MPGLGRCRRFVETLWEIIIFGIAAEKKTISNKSSDVLELQRFGPVRISTEAVVAALRPVKPQQSARLPQNIPLFLKRDGGRGKGKTSFHGKRSFPLPPESPTLIGNRAFRKRARSKNSIGEVHIPFPVIGGDVVFPRTQVVVDDLRVGALAGSGRHGRRESFPVPEAPDGACVVS